MLANLEKRGIVKIEAAAAAAILRALLGNFRDLKEARPFDVSQSLSVVGERLLESFLASSAS